MTTEDGRPFVRLDEEAAKGAEDEFASEDLEPTTLRRKVRRSGEQPVEDAAGRTGEDDDFEIAVDEEEFGRHRQPTAPLDVERLEELLAACVQDVHDPAMDTQGSSPSGVRHAASTGSQAAGALGSMATGPAWPAALQGVLREGTPPSVLAIDFGTSYSSVGVVIDGRTHVLPVTSSGRRVIPSVVGIDEQGCAVVGDPARQMLVTEPANVLASPKRLLGRVHDHHEVQALLSQMAMESEEGPRGEVVLLARGRTYTVAQLCAPILHHLRSAAREYVGRDITDVIMTVPVAFDQGQRRELSEAAAMAGLRVRLFLEEPTAAVLANRHDLRAAGLAAVYDFGGGTFDFSVVRVDEGARLSVVTNAGDNWLGGDDFDYAIASSAADAFWRETNIELRHDAVRWQRLLLESERAKRELSRKRETVLKLEDAALTASGALDLTISLTRDQLAELSQDLIQRTLDTCETALGLCDLEFKDLNALYMSGGTSFMPAVMGAVAQAFGKPPLVAAPPDMAVVLGAANYTATMADLPAEAEAEA